MRLSALLPVALGIAALVLSLLSLFAGSKKGFMEDYAIVTLNTSRIGENLLNSSSDSSSSSSSGSSLTSWLKNITDTIGSDISSDIENDIDNDVSSLAKTLGVHDWYSAHMLDYCEGYYTPVAVPNATYPSSDIHKNITYCSKKKALYSFNPTTILQNELNSSGNSDISLSDLDWPSEVKDGLSALRTAQRAAFIIYCIAIAFIFIATGFAVVSVFLDGRLSAFIDILLWLIAFLASGIASAIVTAIGVKAAKEVNKYGSDVGIVASKGDKFLAITWAATGCVFLGLLVWMVECVVGRGRTVRRRTTTSTYTARKY